MTSLFTHRDRPMREQTLSICKLVNEWLIQYRDGLQNEAYQTNYPSKLDQKMHAKHSQVTIKTINEQTKSTMIINIWPSLKPMKTILAADTESISISITLIQIG